LEIAQVLTNLKVLIPSGLSSDALALVLLQAHLNLLEHALDAFRISLDLLLPTSLKHLLATHQH